MKQSIKKGGYNVKILVKYKIIIEKNGVKYKKCIYLHKKTLKWQNSDLVH